MEVLPTELPEVALIRPQVFRDDRGFFLETWQERRFSAAGINAPFVQDNHSRSMQWTLRGLHYQIEQPQGKLVRVAHGRVLDVAVDIRRSSSTFGKSMSAILSDENQCMLWIPPGFAHGFLVLSTQADFLYRCTAFWNAALERSIAWNDPDLGIRWPLPASVQPNLSKKDAAAPLLRNSDCMP